MGERIAPPWALILAGGNGTRRRADLVTHFDHHTVVVTGESIYLAVMLAEAR
jgi:hypothetical protein